MNTDGVRRFVAEIRKRKHDSEFCELRGVEDE